MTNNINTTNDISLSMMTSLTMNDVASLTSPSSDHDAISGGNAVLCCTECGKEEVGINLKACGACKLVKYCGPTCQRNHWPTHKTACKLRAAELRDEALFKDPPSKEECPICFLPMPILLLSCISLPPATISSIPIFDFAEANEGLAKRETEAYFSCCGKSICAGCEHSFNQTGNMKCPFCNSDRSSQTDEEMVAEMMKRMEVNDAASIRMLANCYYNGYHGLQQDHSKAMELYARAANLGWGKAHCYLGNAYYKGGNMKKAKFHLEAAAMAGNEVARYNLGGLEARSGNIERAIDHLRIAASAGHYNAMYQLKLLFEGGDVSRESVDSTLVAYNNSCAEVRSEARDAYLRTFLE